MSQNLKTIADFLLRDMEGEVALTKSVFAAVPADRLDYTPDAKSKTALGLLRHITLEDEWLLNAVADGALAGGAPPDDSDECGVMCPNDAVARYDERIPAAMARVRALSDDELGREIDIMGKFKLSAIGLLSMAVRHSVHHRGQLSTYLRPMGGKVPGIYGPTADLPWS
ncbi:MAG TPA: DinB family protein [Thermoanaerobaculia bacterium]|nr:DinB family protein [Thermoanaerobaculia bacterium]